MRYLAGRLLKFALVGTVLAYFLTVAASFAAVGEPAAAAANYIAAAVVVLFVAHSFIESRAINRRIRELDLDDAGAVDVMVLLTVIVVACIASAAVLVALHDPIPALISGIGVAAIAGKLTLAQPLTPATSNASPPSSSSSGSAPSAPSSIGAAVPPAPPAGS